MIPSLTSFISRTGRIGVLGYLCAVSPGCSSWIINNNQPLVVRSLTETPVAFPLESTTGYYSSPGQGAYAFFLSDIPIESFIQGTVTEGVFLHVDLHWIPKPGATPLDIAATNATIRLVIFTRNEIGIYGGAGYAQPHGKPEPLNRTSRSSLDGFAVEDRKPADYQWGLTFRQSSLTLLDHTPGFQDLLSPAEITGSIQAILNPIKSHQLHLAASQFVTNALGKTRFVRSGAGSGESGSDL